MLKANRHETFRMNPIMENQPETIMKIEDNDSPDDDYFFYFPTFFSLT